MSRMRLLVSAVSVAVAVGRHPVTRAALRNAPKLVPNDAKVAAFNSAKKAAYHAGVAVRRIIPKSLV